MNVIFVASLMAATLGAPAPADLAAIVSRGDIVRTAPPKQGEAWLPLYQGNGRFGSCFGPWGLHTAPGESPGYELHGKTQFMHTAHFARLGYGMDYLLPVGLLHWETEPDGVWEYEQKQSFFDGIVVTRFYGEYKTGLYKVRLVSWFDPAERNLAGFLFDVEGHCPALVVRPSRKLDDLHYGQTMRLKTRENKDGGLWEAEYRHDHAPATRLYVRTDVETERIRDGLRIALEPGRHSLMIGVNKAPEKGATASLKSSIAKWRNFWRNAGWLDLPDARAQQVWVRSMAYLRSSYRDDASGPAPPNGLSGNLWPFHFAQDLSYIHPVLLATGQLGTARAWIEYWHGHLNGMRDYTRRRFGVEGVLTPWNTPYGRMAGFHVPEPPNRFANAIHNGGYLARMAHETAVMLDDADWTAHYALPIIEESARFYAAILTKEADGLWHLSVEPSIGQDEYGGENRRDYLCALFSAQYCLRQAVNHGLDKDGRLAAILKDGLAFPALLTPQGYYASNAGATDGSALGRQKHPVQLNPLAFLPVADSPDPATRQAHAMRYAITEDATKPVSYGWSFGEFLLASARMGDIEAWRKDWESVRPAGYADPGWVQFYESSNRTAGPFYMTTHGLYAQALLDGVVSSFWGPLEIGRCIPWAGRVRFGNLRTLAGVTVSGELQDGAGSATLTAWKDTEFTYQGETVELSKGDQKSLELR